MLLGAALTVLAVLAPGHWRIGPLTVGLRSVRNPVLAMVVGYIMWRTTFDGFGYWLQRRLTRLDAAGSQLGELARQVPGRFRELWRRWGWRERAVFVVVACQTLFVLRFWENYPSNLAQEREGLDLFYRETTHKLDGRELPVVEGFSRRVCQQLPADARILFHGQTAGLRFAYEVYPRRVFMLPQEMRVLAAEWHVQPQLRDIPADGRIEYWRERLPDTAIDERQFIREHRIDYVVTFDEYEIAKCRVEPVR